MWLPWQDSDRVIQQPKCYYALLEIWDLIQLLAAPRLAVCGVAKWGKLLDSLPINHANTPAHAASSMKTWRFQVGVEELMSPVQNRDLNPTTHLLLR